jgi:hypothetical protein
VVTNTIAAAGQAPRHGETTLAARLRAGGFAVLAAWILFSPALAQLFDVKAPIIRPWIMFKDVGVGVLKGRFILQNADGSEAVLTPLQVLGRDRYPVERQPYRFDRRVLRDADLSAFAAEFCAAREGADLRFEGKVGAGASWRPLAAGNLCAEPAR